MTNQENRAALTVLAVHVNRIHAALDGDVVRLAFAEGMGDAIPQFRMAVTLSIINAQALMELLVDVLRVRQGATALPVEGAKCH